MYDLLVIGGGPAGLTATMYAIRKRLNVLMVSRDLGGKTNYRLALPWIDDYQVIRGIEVVNKFRSELEYLEFARLMQTVDSVTEEEDHFLVHTKEGKELQAKAVIVASGTRQEFLNVPGEKEFIMRGLCYSALSYAPLFIDKVVVVIGDDDLALRSAAELQTVVEKVYLVSRSKENLATPIGQKLLKAANVTLKVNHKVNEFRGDEYAKSVVLEDDEGHQEEIFSDAIFIEMGLVPNSKIVENLVELDHLGRIIVDNDNRTSKPGIYAAGDVTNSFAEQVLVALGEGTKAALSAYDYLLPLL